VFRPSHFKYADPFSTVSSVVSKRQTPPEFVVTNLSYARLMTDLGSVIKMNSSNFAMTDLRTGFSAFFLQAINQHFLKTTRLSPARKECEKGIILSAN
jgi:hypothetical protein